MTPETQPESGATPQKMPLAYRLYGLFCTCSVSLRSSPW